MNDLRTLAEAATPGPWELVEERFMRCLTLVVNAVDGTEVVPDGMPYNLEYIAAASPDVILKLLRKLDLYRQIVTDLAEVDWNETPSWRNTILFQLYERAVEATGDTK